MYKNKIQEINKFLDIYWDERADLDFIKLDGGRNY